MLHLHSLGAARENRWPLILLLLLSLGSPARTDGPPDDPPPAPPPDDTPTPARDYSRYYAPQPDRSALGSFPGAARTSGVYQAAASADSVGFVKPADFQNIFSLASAASPFTQQQGGSGGGAFFGQPSETPFPSQLHGSASTHSGTGFAGSGGFGKSGASGNGGFGFGAIFDSAGSPSDTGFRPQDFIKSKRGTSEKALAKDNLFFSPNFFDSEKDYTAPDYNPAAYTPRAAASEAQTSRNSKPVSFDDDFSFANFEKEVDDDDDDPRYRVEEADDDDEEKVSKPAAASSRRKEKNTRYPSYSSYYNTHPLHEQQKDEDKSAEDDEFNHNYESSDPDLGSSQLNDAPAGASEERPEPSRRPATRYEYDNYKAPPKNARPAASSGYKAALYKGPSDPFFEGKSRYTSSGEKSRGPSSKLADPHSNRGPAKFTSQPSEFRPSPIDPLYTKGAASIPSYDYDHSPSSEYKAGLSSSKSFPSSYDSGSTASPARLTEAATKTHCKKIQKRLDKAHDKGMTCFVCDDPKSGGSYEQCAYGSEPVSRAYFVGRSQAFSSDQDRPYSFRQRRYLTVGPAPAPNRALLLSRKVREEPDDFFGSYTFDDKDDYRFGPEYFGGEQREASESQPTETKEAASSDKCKKVVKKGSVCMVCADPASGGSYEQCSYVTQPEAQSYSFGRSSSYGSAKKPRTPDRERRRRYIQKTDKGSKTPQDKFARQQGKAKSANLRKRNEEGHADTPYEGAEYEIPREVVESSEPITGPVEHGENVPNRGGVGLDPFLYGASGPFGPSEENQKPETAASEEKEDVQEDKTKPYKDYFTFLFPEHSKDKRGRQKKKTKGKGADDDSEEEASLVSHFDLTGDDDHFTAETKDDKTDFLIPDYFSETGPKKDLEKMLGEFTQKDRSECTKVVKDLMTCFQCVDKKGMQHEECMFVAASEPKKSHLAYHESKEFKTAPKKPGEAAVVPATEATTSETKAVSSVSASTAKTSPAPLKKTTQLKKAASTQTIKSRGEKKFKLSDVVTTARPAPLTSPISAPKVSSRQVRRAVDSDEHEEADSKGEQKDEDHEDAEEDHDHDDDAPKKEASSGTTTGNEPDREEFVVPEGPEGLYSDDTKPVYDKVLKLSLPKYMLTKSEHEAIFDEVLSSGV